MAPRSWWFLALAALSGTVPMGCGAKRPGPTPEPAAEVSTPPPAVPVAAEPVPSFPAATAADVAKVAAEAVRFGGQARNPVRADVPAVHVQFAAGTPKEAEVPDLVRRLTATGVPVTVHVGASPHLSPAALTQFLGMPNLLGLETNGPNLLAAVEGFEGVPRLEVVSIYGPTITDVRPVVKLKRLRVLSVSARDLTGVGLDRLTELPDLHSLSLGSAGLSGAVLAPVWRLTGLQELRLEGGTIGDADLAPVAHMLNLRKAFFSAPKVTANVYEHLTDLPELRTPVLGSVNFTDASLGHFGRLRRLNKIERLQFFGPEVTDVGLAHLRGMTGLKELGLYGTPKLGPDGMAVLAGLPNLTRLAIDTTTYFPQDESATGAMPRPKSAWIPPAAALDGLTGTNSLKVLSLSNATDDYLIPVARIGSLEQLQLTWHTESEGAARVPKAVLTDAGLAHLRGATQLRALDASRASVSDAGLAHLSGLTHLTSLKLGAAPDPGGERITDRGAPALAKLTGLQQLELHRTAITDAGVAELAALPALKSFSLLESPLTDGVVDALAKFPALENVNLSGGRITAPGLNQLRELKKGILIYGR